MRNNADVCHDWAHSPLDSNEHGQGSNIFYEGNSIYSYGHHFEMARKIGYNTILWFDQTYSPTTSKHQSYLRSAISHFDIWYVQAMFDPREQASRKNEAHKRNLGHWYGEIKDLQINKIDYSRTRQATKDRAYLDILSIQELMVKYIEKFNVPKHVWGKYCNSLDEFAELYTQVRGIEKKQQKAEARRHKRAEKARMERLKTEIAEFENIKLPAWRRNDKYTPRYVSHPAKSNEAYLRLMLVPHNAELDKLKPMVETSKNIMLEIKEARRILAFIRKRKGLGWERNGETFGIINDRFQIDRITKDGDLIAGCHTIMNDEIETFASNHLES